MKINRFIIRVNVTRAFDGFLFFCNINQLLPYEIVFYTSFSRVFFLWPKKTGFHGFFSRLNWPKSTRYSANRCARYLSLLCIYMYVYYAQVFFLCRVSHSLRARFGGVATTQQTLRRRRRARESVVETIVRLRFFFISLFTSLSYTPQRYFANTVRRRIEIGETSPSRLASCWWRNARQVSETKNNIARNKITHLWRKIASDIRCKLITCSCPSWENPVLIVGFPHPCIRYINRRLRTGYAFAHRFSGFSTIPQKSVFDSASTINLWFF